MNGQTKVVGQFIGDSTNHAVIAQLIFIVDILFGYGHLPSNEELRQAVSYYAESVGL